MLQHAVVPKTINVTPKEISALYAQLATLAKSKKQFHVIDILIPLNTSPTAEAKKAAQTKAESIIAQLKKGVAYSTIIDKELGSDMGWRPETQLPSVFVEPLASMKVGDVYGPIVAGNGLHVIKLVGVRGKEGKLPTRAEVKQMIVGQEFQKALQAWLPKLRETSYVKILD